MENQQKLKCWEYKNCGKQHECPAYPKFGRQCARVSGTLCTGKPSGYFAQKLKDCMTECSYYKSEHYDRHYTEGGNQ